MTVTAYIVIDGELETKLLPNLGTYENSTYGEALRTVRKNYPNLKNYALIAKKIK